MTDITLKTDEGYFCWKVCAIILHENKVLMIKNENFPYYYPVGGRVKFGETSEDAVMREVYEETGVHFKIDRLCFVHENFFTADFMGAEHFAGGAPFHEVALFYLMKKNDEVTKVKGGSLGGDGGKESLHWLPLDKLTDSFLYPEFFKTELKNLKNKAAHSITKGGKAFRAK